MNIARLSCLTAALGLLVMGSADAQTWAQRHPRRDQVNARLTEQNYRIRQGVRDGQLSTAQAAQLHADDHAIRGEERADAAVNGSHITAGERRQINQQENANSQAILGERH